MDALARAWIIFGVALAAAGDLIPAAERLLLLGRSPALRLPKEVA